MALSGSKTTAIGSHWSLILEWTATQSVSANTSTVTAKLYFKADSYGATSSSASKTASITIAGTTTNNTASGLAKVSAGQKKLICTATKTISHASDGTGSFAISGSFALGLTLGGTTYNTVSVASTTYTLNTIPRKSTLTSGQSWTAGSNTTIKINRASSSFTHTVTIAVNGTTIKTITGVGASTTVSFSTTENTNIFKALAQATSKSTTVTVTTYSGSTSLGSNSYTGTCTCPATSTMTWQSEVAIGGTISGTITRKNSAFAHACKISTTSNADVFTLYNGATTSYSYNTSSIASTLYALCPNSNSIKLKIRMWTMYNGVQVGAERNGYITFKVTNSNPTFPAPSGLYYWDNSHESLTGNNQYIIQNLSDFRCGLASGHHATAKNGATMSHYIVSCGNKSVKVSYNASADIYATIGRIDANSNQTFTIKAVDSRGNSASISKTVTIIPFQPTTIQATAERKNNFENLISFKANGTFSPLVINGVSKHDFSTATFKLQLIALNGVATTSSVWTYKVDYNTNNGTWSKTLTDIYDSAPTNTLTFKITLETNLTVAETTVNVKKGQPLFALDTKKNSIGFNDIPTEENQILINGSVKFGANNFASKQGAVNLNNSDVINANQIAFADALQGNNSEGFMFKNTGGTTSTNLYAIDGQLWMQKTHGSGSIVNVANADNITALWSGSVYPNEGFSVTLSRTINNFPTGLAFIWSDFDNSTQTANNSDWHCSFVPRNFIMQHNQSSAYIFTIPSTDNTFVTKRLYIQTNGTVIKGHALNYDTDAKKDVVLRFIYGI